MKKEVFIFACVSLLILAYVFSNDLRKSTKAPQMTLQDPFEKLLGVQTDDWNYLQTEQDKSSLEFYKLLYEKNKQVQFNSDPFFKIPKVVHCIWLGPRPFPSKSVENIRTWMAHHPDWTFMFWTDRKRPVPCHGMQVRHLDDFNFDFLEKEFQLSRNWGERADILCFEILYQEGGLYIDHDTSCVRPFHGLHTGYDFYAGLEMPHEEIDGNALTVGISIVGSKPHHPVIRKVIETVSKRWDEVTERLSSSDPLARSRLVGHRTYVAMTYASQSHLDLAGNTDIIFPASYFYPKHSLPAFYACHSGTSGYVGETSSERYVSKSLRALREIDLKTLKIEIVSLITLIGCFIFYINTKRYMKKYLKG